MITAVSDSHVPTRADGIPEEVIDSARSAELTVHAGDLVEREVLNRIEEVSEVLAVKGNCERFDLPVSETFSRGEVKFGIYHGAGIHPRGHLPTLVNVAEELGADVLITGHTHRQRSVREDGKIIVNPGSCTGLEGTAGKGKPSFTEMRVSDRLELEEKRLTEQGLKVSEQTFQL